MRKELEKKVAQAVRLIQAAGQAAGKKGQPVEVCYSGGKDSDVILELAKMAGINYRAIYKNTTIDPPGTIGHVREMGVEIVRPRQSFFQIVEKKGFPTRQARFCCERLKEYKILDVMLQGIRRSESTARAKRYKEPMVCRMYGKGEHASVFLPILEWSDADVLQFIMARGLKLAPVYYSCGGVIDVKRRLGCMGCPLPSDHGLSDFKKYPNLVKAWIRAGKKWMDTHPTTRCHQLYGDVYRLFVKDVFINSRKGWASFMEATSGFFGDVDCKQFLEDYFKIKLP